MNRYDVTPRERAAWAIQATIERNAIEAFEGPVIERPSPLGPAADRWWAPYVTWCCSSCGERVTDRGRYEGAPDNDEEDHAHSCERHHRDIAGRRGVRGAVVS